MEKQNLKKAHRTSIQWLWCLLFIVSSSSSSLLPVSATENSITTTNSITKNQTIISAGAEQREVVWTSNVTVNSFNITSSTVAVLLDDGNLQLRSGEGGYRWQSFDHPSDTYVAEMKIAPTEELVKNCILRHGLAVAVAIVSIGLLLISIFGYLRRRKRQIITGKGNTSFHGTENSPTVSEWIVTGKVNTSFHGTENSSTVSEWAWDNSMEGRALDLIDPSMRDTYNPLQAVKCINIGLLCVQEIMSERPTMSEVVVMLSNETATIQPPKKPAFTIHRTDRSSQMSSRCSNNKITLTNIEPQ
ncbi:Bulb-type lectin domain-containing protein [Cynara cardunculus var. scolymus]|uniref:Bulb-type lectin domain-containing protein n=1 Tax=Cynara cardunculus var. scolymus TaxID=59895 RepID=A0A103YDC4_CYNCS|nr:Bulb-type lectin domain-containing protein [Cynara cardunculus var. scolymus]